jgi:hypothetical protein
MSEEHFDSEWVADLENHQLAAFEHLEELADGLRFWKPGEDSSPHVTTRQLLMVGFELARSLRRLYRLARNPIGSGACETCHLPMNRT